jgi:hypothetical protein
MVTWTLSILQTGDNPSPYLARAKKELLLNYPKKYFCGVSIAKQFHNNMS